MSIDQRHLKDRLDELGAGKQSRVVVQSSGKKSEDLRLSFSSEGKAGGNKLAVIEERKTTYLIVTPTMNNFHSKDEAMKAYHRQISNLVDQINDPLKYPPTSLPLREDKGQRSNFESVTKMIEDEVIAIGEEDYELNEEEEEVD